ncbi:hypothetical protein ACMFMG_011981 [Clarireedia jacksonii]
MAPRSPVASTTIRALEIEIEETQQAHLRLRTSIQQLNARKKELTMEAKANNLLLQDKKKLFCSLTRRHKDAGRQRMARANATREQRKQKAEKQKQSRKRLAAFEDIWTPYQSYRPTIEMLKNRFNSIVKENIPTDYETELANVGLFIYNRWEPFRDSYKTKEKKNIKASLAMFLSLDDLDEWLEKNSIDRYKTAIVRVPNNTVWEKCFQPRGDAFWEAFEGIGEKDTMLDVQGRNDKGIPEVQRIRAVEVKHRYESDLNSPDAKPINMLSLNPKSGSLLRLGLHNEDMGFLDSIVDRVHNSCGRITASNLFGHFNFRIHATSGAISGWHMDNMGYFTVIFMHGDETDLKLWAVADIAHLSTKRQKEIWADFGEHGPIWYPPDDVKIRVHPLRKGDALIMWPGTIHAPMTPTPCLMSGYLGYHKKMIGRSFEVIDFLLKHPNCTNEDVPGYSSEIIPHILAAVEESPEDYGVSESDLHSFRRVCRAVFNKQRNQPERNTKEQNELQRS